MTLKEILLNEKVVMVRSETEEPFHLKSGKKSRVFINIKKATLNPKILNKIVDVYIGNRETHTILYSDEIDTLASIAVGGVPIATAISLRVGIPQVIIRENQHDRGMETEIIGDCKGTNCILIEDVVTTGGSIVKAVKAIRDAGGICNIAFTVVDREEGAEQACKENNISLFSLIKKSDLIEKEV